MKFTLTPRIKSYLNGFLLAAGVGQLGVIWYLTSASPSVAPTPALPAQVVPVETKQDAPIAPPSQVHMDADDGAVVAKIKSPKSAKVAKAELSKQSRQALKVVRNPHPSAASKMKQAQRVAKAKQIATVVRKSNKLSARVASNEDESLEKYLGHDAIKASNELIADGGRGVANERDTFARELGLREKDFHKIWRKEQRLRKDLRRADMAGAAGTRRLLLADHHAWVKEFLGEARFERYMELSR